MRLEHPQGLTYPSFRGLKTFEDISSVLTLSSPSRLNIPEIYDTAKESLNSFFPHTPTPYYKFGQSEEALVLAIEHDVKPVRDEPLDHLVLLCLNLPAVSVRMIRVSTPPITSPLYATV